MPFAVGNAQRGCIRRTLKTRGVLRYNDAKLRCAARAQPPASTGEPGGGGHQGSGRREQLEKLGNITRRYGLLDGGDLRVLDRDLDPALVKAFHYGYDHRDASRGQCAPDEGQYLRSLKLKKMGSRSVPLDDENDGIVVCPRGNHRSCVGATAWRL